MISVLKCADASSKKQLATICCQLMFAKIENIFGLFYYWDWFGKLKN
jgi:hypothetical protein